MKIANLKFYVDRVYVISHPFISFDMSPFITPNHKFIANFNLTPEFAHTLNTLNYTFAAASKAKFYWRNVLFISLKRCYQI